MNSLKYSNTVLINLVIASIIPFLIWGPFFPDLIVSVSALFFLYFVLKNNNFYYLNNKLFIIFLLFCIFSTISSLESKDISLSIKSSLFYFRIGLFSCFIWYVIDKDKNEKITSFHLFEVYRNSNALDIHRNTVYYKNYRSKIIELLEKPIEVKILNSVDCI